MMQQPKPKLLQPLPPPVHYRRQAVLDQTDAYSKIVHSAEFRRCLETLDVSGIRKLWAHIAPHLHQPRTDHEALVTLHLARTGASSMPVHLRRYSDRWLRERGIGSQLPPELRINHLGRKV